MSSSFYQFHAAKIHIIFLSFLLLLFYQSPLCLSQYERYIPIVCCATPCAVPAGGCDGYRHIGLHGTGRRKWKVKEFHVSSPLYSAMPPLRTCSPPRSRTTRQGQLWPMR